MTKKKDVYKRQGAVGADISGTFGIQADNNGITSLTTMPKCTPKLKISGSFYWGLSLEPRVKILSNNVASASLTGKAGIKLNASWKPEILKQEKTIHSCEKCIEGKIKMCIRDRICDGRKAIGIAGIMGGENSMITDNVKTMLFEAACFDGTNIRLSGRKIGLRTDASAKFEKGLDPNTAIEAMNRACQLIEELGAGEVVGGVVDVYPNVKGDKRIPFEPEKYNKLLGTDIAKETMLAYFSKIDLGYDPASNEVIVPSWRQDLECDADLAEEVARFFGYDKIPTTLPSGEATTGKLTFKLRIEAVAREIAEFCGFSQGMTYSCLLYTS